MRRVMLEISLLLFFILLLAGGSMYWIERVGLVNTSFTTDFITGILSRDPDVVEETISNDSLLIDKLRLEKKEKELRTQEIELARQVQELELQRQNLENDIVLIEVTKEEIEAQKKSLDEIRNQYENKNERVRATALSLMNMPPNNAVEILIKYDDQLIVDTLLAVNAISDEQGSASLVPYWLSIMEPERAGEVQKKIVYYNR